LYFSDFVPFQVPAYIPLMKIIELLSGLRLWRRYQKMRLLCGLTQDAEVLLYSCRIALNTLVRLWMVVEKP
jgi:hypothetical protein